MPVIYMWLGWFGFTTAKPLYLSYGEGKNAILNPPLPPIPTQHTHSIHPYVYKIE